MMPSKSSNQGPRGFTLLEVVIYVALLAIGLSALVFVQLSGLQTHSLVQNELELLEIRRLAELTIRGYAERALAVTTPASGSANQLVLGMPDPAESPVTFALAGNRLTLQIGTGTATPITPPNVRVTDFTVTRLSGSPPSIAVSLSYEADAAKATIPTSSSFTLTLRYE